MPLTRSRENLLNLEEPTNVSFTVNLDSPNNGVRTRSATRNRTVQSQNGPTGNSANNNIDTRIRKIVFESLGEFRNDMINHITAELATMFQNNITQPNAGHTRHDDDNNSPRFNQNSDPEPILAEKVLNIIRNWRIKFTGHDNKMTVDEFIYRVNILTTNNLRGDFDTLCKHAHSLFEGKALEWFWRYHRQTNDMDWHSLTTALRNQYKDDCTDFDILDDIRKRKQELSENFDEYLDSILAMTDKLKIPISDRDLCETIYRNLKPEVRHELLHLEIASISQLRKEVRKHEKFMKEIHIFDSRKSKGTRISEIESDDKDINTAKEVSDDICALHQLRCWNCDKEGHTYFDCMEPRRIFCYGCGAKDIFKPNCTKCSKKYSGNGQKDVRRTC